MKALDNGACYYYYYDRKIIKKTRFDNASNEAEIFSIISPHLVFENAIEENGLALKRIVRTALDPAAITTE